MLDGVIFVISELFTAPAEFVLLPALGLVLFRFLTGILLPPEHDLNRLFRFSGVPGFWRD